MERQLTEGRPFGVLLRYALPVLGGNLFQLFYTLADTVIVGKALGADALAAVGSTGIISYFVLCFVQGLTGGFGICLGQCCGAGDETGMRRSAAVSWTLSAVFTLLLTPLVCLLARPVLGWMQTPEDIFTDAYAYLFVILLGTGATVFYNIISYMLRALGDSRTPLVFLVLSSLLNIGLDILFIVPFHMGVAGAAWATVLSQLLSAILCTIVGLRKYPVLRTRRADFVGSRIAAARHLRVGFLMGFQMSVMCIGQLVVQACVNKLGTAAYQIAISGYVAQNYGAHRFDRIREGVRASLIQLESVNVLMCAAMLLARRAVVSLFIDAPTEEIISYAGGYLTAVAPFYVVLGLLIVYRSTVQSMGNSTAPFLACVVELVMRISGALGLARVLGYTGVCCSSPLAWIGATALLIPFYRREMRKGKNIAAEKRKERPPCGKAVWKDALLLLLTFFQKLLRRCAEELCKRNEVRRAWVGCAALPLGDRLPADAQRLRHKLLRHFALRPAALQYLTERSGARCLLLPHGLGADVLSQRTDEKHEHINANGEDQKRHDGHKNGKSHIITSFLPSI